MKKAFAAFVLFFCILSIGTAMELKKNSIGYGTVTSNTDSHFTQKSPYGKYPGIETSSNFSGTTAMQNSVNLRRGTFRVSSAFTPIINVSRIQYHSNQAIVFRHEHHKLLELSPHNEDYLTLCKLII